MGEVHFARETLAQVRGAELTRLLEAHYLEIAHFKDIPLAVDWDAYAQIEANRRLRAFTARTDGRLIGYAAYMVGHAPHYATSLQATQDVVFLVPQCRNQHIGLRFLAWCDRQLTAEGVQVVYQHSKVALPMDAVLKRMRYELVDTLWAKRLDLWAPRQP